MKKIILAAGLFFPGISAICQQEENGTIYIKHPFIEVVNKVQDAYLERDSATLKMIYADTAKFIATGMEKLVPIAEGIRMWMSDFDYYEDIMVKPEGYPDFLHYKKGDAKVVQSWWTWSGKSKKTGAMVKIPMVIFDNFNSDGKIVYESIYGDFSKMKKD